MIHVRRTGDMGRAMMPDNAIRETIIQRVGRGRHLHRFIPVFDKSGKIVSTVVKPFMVELRVRDLMQILVGSSVLAIPVVFTEETWNLGQRLPVPNVLMLGAVSLIFIAVFVFANFYRHYMREYLFEYVKRVLATYFLSLMVVGVLLTIIQQCPWSTDWLLAVKRIVIVGLPASMSATLTDSIK